METTIVYWGILGLYWDNGKQDGNYYSVGFRVLGAHLKLLKLLLAACAGHRLRRHKLLAAYAGHFVWSPRWRRQIALESFVDSLLDD